MAGTTDTAPTAAGPAARAAGRGAWPRGGTFPRLLAMEWVKLRSPRSTAWTLLLAAVCSVGLTALIGGLAGAADGSGGFGVIETAAFGVHTGQLFMLVLGALTITGEYASGSIRTTLASVAGRGRVLAAKAVVLAATTLAASSLIALACWGVAAGLLPDRPGTGGTAAETARLLLGGAAYPTLVALLALGTGAALRGTAGALGLIIGLQAVIPSLFPLLPASVADRLLPAMPPFAAEVLLTGQAREGDYGPLVAFLVLCAWAAVALAAGYGTLKRRDA